MRRHLLAAGAALLLAAGLNGAAYAQPAPAPAAAQALKPLDAAERSDVIEKLAKTLEANFVFPDTAMKYAAMLRANLASGAYDDLTDPDAFGTKVTADLQAVAPDGHLRLATQTTFQTPRPPAADIPVSARAAPGPRGLEEARMIGDVAFLRFSGFPDGPETGAKARAFLLAHAGETKAVIIDARPHRGGGLDPMNTMLPLFYSRTTTLVRMDTRAGIEDEGPLQDDATLVRQPSPPTLVRRDHVVIPDAAEKRLRKVPIYYLTSRRTASAAEHLALAFKRTHRATLVGETTAGAGHYGGVLDIGDRFAAFVPVGRSYDPDTNWDWEGKGVTPDVPVHTDQALDEALKLAKAAGAHP